MKKILENLWYLCQTVDPIEHNEEKIKLLNDLVKVEEDLLAILDEKQKEMFENFDDCLNEIHSIAEKDAFIKGVRFATVFLFEALCAD